MKIVFAFCITLTMLTFSCKKSNDHINTPPVVNDTTKPPVVNVDTSTLLKSMREYSYSGTNIVDSELIQWTYDDQRRVTQQNYAFGNSNDTTRYTYLNDRYIATFDGYTNGSLRGIRIDVYYLGPDDRVDSMLSSFTGYGIEVGSNYNSGAYFYYNQENQETLEMHFSGAQGARSPEDSIKYFYTGMNLDSAIIWTPYPDSGMQKNFVEYFSNGDLSSGTSYENNVLGAVTNFDYSNIPTGGLNIAYITDLPYMSFFRTTHLKSASTTNYASNAGTQTYQYIYELDAANRVTDLAKITNGVVDQKYVFTYY